MYCWLSISALRGASLVITRRVVKADYGWTFGHLDVLTIANSLLSNDVVTRVAITSVLKNYYHLLLLFYTFLPTHFSTSSSLRNKRFS